MKLDNTMVEKFNVCPREFYFRHVRKIIRVGNPSIHLVFGGAIHTALEMIYKGSTLEEAQQVFIAELGDAEDTTGKKTPECGLKILKAYVKEYFPERWKVLHVESSIAVELSSDILYYGRIDLVVELMGVVYIVDHKTSSNMRFMASPNHQFTGYIHNALTLGINCTGAIANILGVYKTKTDFKRPMTYRSEGDIREWKHYVYDTKDRIDKCLKEEFFPIFAHSCYRYGTTCPYEELCTAEDKWREDIIEGGFIKDEWKPWESEG